MNTTQKMKFFFLVCVNRMHFSVEIYTPSKISLILIKKIVCKCVSFWNWKKIHWNRIFCVISKLLVIRYTAMTKWRSNKNTITNKQFLNPRRFSNVCVCAFMWWCDYWSWVVWPPAVIPIQEIGQLLWTGSSTENLLQIIRCSYAFWIFFSNKRIFFIFFLCFILFRFIQFYSFVFHFFNSHNSKQKKIR